MQDNKEVRLCGELLYDEDGTAVVAYCTATWGTEHTHGDVPSSVPSAPLPNGPHEAVVLVVDGEVATVNLVVHGIPNYVVCLACNPDGEYPPHQAHVEVWSSTGWIPACSDRVTDWWASDYMASVRDRKAVGAPDRWIRPLDSSS